MKRKLFLVGIILISLIACGPIYKDHYDYYQPEDREGKYCVNSCAAVKGGCRDECIKNNQICEQKARDLEVKKEEACYRKKEYCLKKPDDVDCPNFSSKSCQEQRHSHPECSMTSCKSSCNSRYDDCFQNCGGEIRVRKECVLFCK